MTYNADKNWDDLIGNELGGLEKGAKDLLAAIREGQALYDEWQSFRDSRADADIATALGRTTAEVADMDSAFSAFDSITRYQNNNTPPAGIDQGFALRVFS